MNKLEVLYKMSKAMKDKEKIMGTVNIIGKSQDGEFVNGTNNFEKDIKAKKLKIDAEMKIKTENIDEKKVIKKEIDLEKVHEMKKMHGHGHKCHGGNKFAKLEVLFKSLNDMELVESADEKVITLDIKDIMAKKVEKIKAMHEKMGDKKECCAKVECEEFKEMFKIKHEIARKIFSGSYDTVVLKLTVNNDFTIKSVQINANGQQEVGVKVSLNY